MGVPNKVHTIQLVKIQPEERLATISELNLSPEITIVSVVDIVPMTEGSTLIAVSPNLRSWNIAGSSGTWRGDECPTGSETVARYQRDIMGTQETQSVLLNGVCDTKPINGKVLQMTLRESDRRSRVMPVEERGLQGNCWDRYSSSALRGEVKDVTKSGLATYLENDRVVLLKSSMRGNHKSSSLRGLIVASGRR